MHVVTKFLSSVNTMAPEARMCVYTCALYLIFMIWGYLQERITASEYIPVGSSLDSDIIRWDFPFVLNVCMATAAYGVSFILESFNKKQHTFPRKLFWRPALAATLASPLGYASLKYINYPLMVLTKSSKPAPIMLIGSVFFGQKYPWFKYVSVVMLCLGISTFTFAQSSPKGQVAESAGYYVTIYSLYGVLLILLNLAMDGYSNNEQDRLYKELPLSATQMMKQTNYWQCLFQASFLVMGAVVFGRSSELFRAAAMLSAQPSLLVDIGLFCTCATVGQLLIFQLIKEYGSLVWVTISVTRQLFTILLSVLLFGHRVNLVQWLGVGLVFSGLGTDIAFTFLTKLKTEHGWDGKMKSLPAAAIKSFSTLSKPRGGSAIYSSSGGGAARYGNSGFSGSGHEILRGTSSSFATRRPGLVSRGASAEYIDIEGGTQLLDGDDEGVEEVEFAPPPPPQLPLSAALLSTRKVVSTTASSSAAAASATAGVETGMKSAAMGGAGSGRWGTSVAGANGVAVGPGISSKGVATGRDVASAAKIRSKAD